MPVKFQCETIIITLNLDFTRFGGKTSYRLVNRGPERGHVQNWNLVIIVPADGLTPDGARPSASTLLTRKLFMISSFLYILAHWELIILPVQNDSDVNCGISVILEMEIQQFITHPSLCSDIDGEPCSVYSDIDGEPCSGALWSMPFTDGLVQDCVESNDGSTVLYKAISMIFHSQYLFQVL